jgi:hypothetical protein
VAGVRGRTPRFQPAQGSLICTILGRRRWRAEACVAKSRTASFCGHGRRLRSMRFGGRDAALPPRSAKIRRCGVTVGEPGVGRVRRHGDGDPESPREYRGGWSKVGVVPVLMVAVDNSRVQRSARNQSVRYAGYGRGRWRWCWSKSFTYRSVREVPRDAGCGVSRSLHGCSSALLLSAGVAFCAFRILLLAALAFAGPRFHGALGYAADERGRSGRRPNRADG